jgi:UDP-N-acetylmuramoyl-tripeptide--D-alanyl-D-alanine ligase
MLTLAHFLEVLTTYQAVGNEPLVASVVIDSREVLPGSLFIAFEGEHVDGHDYVSQAFATGALAALVQRPVADFAVIDCRDGAAPAWNGSTPVQIVVDDTLLALQQVARHWRNRFDVTVIGITGSVGKTTTKELVARVLSQQFNTLKSRGNYNNEIGLPLTLLELRPEHECVVLEMGMYVPGDIALLCDIARPQIGVVTLVGTVHLERAGTREALVAGKRELVEALPADGVAILNADEPLVLGMASATQAQVFTYGLNPAADLTADMIDSMGLAGIEFSLYHENDTVRVKMPMLGRHSVHTALRATAIGLVMGMAWESIVTGLQAHRDELRLLVVEGPHGATILDDTYNASPASTMAVLDLLQNLDGRRIAVLGDMLELGSAEKESHQKIGIRAADVADILIAVGKLGRIAGEEALAYGMNPNSVFFADNSADAVPVLRELIQPGDMILVKGSRGGRLDRIVTALNEEAVAS